MLALAATGAVAARPDPGDERVRLVLDGFDAPAGLALDAAARRGDRAAVDSRSTIRPADLGAFSDAEVLVTRGGGLPWILMATRDTPGVWRVRPAHRANHVREPPDARLTRSFEGDEPRWTIEWRGGPRLVALKVKPPVSGLHVRDLEYHEDYPAATAGEAFALVAPDRVRPVVVVADGVAPVRFGAEELRVALAPGASRVLERATQPGVRLLVKFSAPGEKPPDLRDVRGFAWDTATGALVRNGLPGAEPGVVAFEALGREAVTVGIQALEASGQAWLGTWDGVPGEAVATVTLVRSGYHYRSCVGPGIDVAREGPTAFAGRPFALLRGETTVESELAPGGWFVQPGEYEVRPTGSSATGSVRCIVRDGVCCEIGRGILVK